MSRSLLLFCNATAPPHCNVLLPAVRAFQKVFKTIVVEPRRYPGYEPARGTKPALIPDTAVMAHTDPPPEVVVCLGGAHYFSQRALRHLRHRSHVVLAGFAFSDPYMLPASMRIARQFDLFYTQDWQTVTDFAALDIPVRRCDPATDPELYRPTRPEPDCDIIYYGRWSLHRNDLVRALASRWRVRLHAYAGETRWGIPAREPLETPQALCIAINRARVALEVSRLDDAEGKYRNSFHLSPRPFLAASCGVPSLVESFHGLEQFFTPGTEIAAFGQNEDLFTVAGRLLQDEGARLAMARAARARVMRQHTWDRRVEAFLLDLTHRQRPTPGPAPGRAYI